MNTLMRPLLFLAGTISLGLGIVGAFMPILPTTPFLLLSAYCYGRSSERLHRWLIEHPRWGCYIDGFLYGGPIPRRAKRAALAALWPAIAVSCAIIYLTAEIRLIALGVPVLLVLIASAVSVFIVTRPTDEECPAGADSRRGVGGDHRIDDAREGKREP